MVPNLGNIAKNHCFPKKLPIYFGNTFQSQKFAISETPVMTFIINKMYQINSKTLESTAQIICLNVI